MIEDKLFIQNFYFIENEIQKYLDILVHKNAISKCNAENTFNDILFLDLSLFYAEISFSEMQQKIIKNIVIGLTHNNYKLDTNSNTYKVFICKSLDIKNDDIIQLINISSCEICYITEFLNGYNLLK